MALNTVTTGNTVLAADINQLVQVLQRAAGQTETGKYWLQGGCYQTSAEVSTYVDSLNRTSTPSGTVIDTADQAPASSAGTPAASSLTANGFLVKFASTAASNTARAGGNYTTSF